MGKKNDAKQRAKLKARVAKRAAARGSAPAGLGGAGRGAPGRTVAVSDATFDRDVLNHDGPVLVDFWAPWCGPCKTVAPILDELAGVYEGRLRIAKIDTEKNRRVPGRYDIRSIPTMMLFRDGEVIDTKVGAQPKGALQRWLDRHVAA